MPELVYTKNNLPTPGQFRADLDRELEMANPVDDLLMLAKRLHDYEKKHNMPSDEFYRRFQAGMLDDELQHSITWVGLYEMFVETKRSLEAALMRLGIESIPDPVTEPAAESTLEPVTA